MHLNLISSLKTVSKSKSGKVPIVLQITIYVTLISSTLVTINVTLASYDYNRLFQICRLVNSDKT